MNGLKREVADTLASWEELVVGVDWVVVTRKNRFSDGSWYCRWLRFIVGVAVVVVRRMESNIVGIFILA